MKSARKTVHGSEMATGTEAMECPTVNKTVEMVVDVDEARQAE